jgi:hypothetical protein
MEFEAAVKCELADAEETDTEMTPIQAHFLVTGYRAMYKAAWRSEEQSWKEHAEIYMDEYLKALREGKAPEMARVSAKSVALKMLQDAVHERALEHYWQIRDDLGI